MGAAISGELMELFSRYVEDHLGLYFPKERTGDLERALRGVSADSGFENPEACIRSFLLAPATRAQIEALASHMTVGETYFFREEKTFDVLKERILPELIRCRREKGRHLRVWSAGCATGEEPYSISILLHSMLPDFKNWDISILATDINPAFLQKASRGIYGEWSFRNAPPMFRERYFRKAAKDRSGSNPRFELIPLIKERVAFQYHNLAVDICPSLTNGTNAMDIIFCRNVLMYFSRGVQEEVSRKFYNSLAEGGWLVVSPVEMSASLFSSFSQVSFPAVSLYKKAPGKVKTGPPVIVQTDTEKTFPGFFDEDGKLQTSEDFPLFWPASESQTLPDPRILLTDTGFNEPGTGPKEEIRREASTGLYQNVLALYQAGRYAEAADEAGRLIKNSGNEDTPALVLLARIYANMGRLDDALGMCEKAISSDKLDPGPYYLLAVIQQEMGLSEESEATLKRILYLDPGFVLAWFAMGNLARRQGRAGESKKQFKNALSAMDRYGQDDLIPESGGLTAGRLAEIININIRETAEE